MCLFALIPGLSVFAEQVGEEVIPANTGTASTLPNKIIPDLLLGLAYPGEERRYLWRLDSISIGLAEF